MEPATHSRNPSAADCSHFRYLQHQHFDSWTGHSYGCIWPARYRCSGDDHPSADKCIYSLFQVNRRHRSKRAVCFHCLGTHAPRSVIPIRIHGHCLHNQRRNGLRQRNNFNRWDWASCAIRTSWDAKPAITARRASVFSATEVRLQSGGRRSEHLCARRTGERAVVRRKARRGSCLFGNPWKNSSGRRRNRRTSRGFRSSRRFFGYWGVVA